MDISLSQEAVRSLRRLLPRLEQALQAEIVAQPQAWRAFQSRLEQRFAALFALYFELYHERYDFFYHLEELLLTLGRAWFERPEALQELDRAREQDPAWFQSHRMVGGVLYVDRFAGNLEGVRQQIPYFRELGLTYLHLMPFFKVPLPENDGGYAVSSYREVHPPLGTMEELSALAAELRRAGISLVVDLVFNHTSNEHAWAKAALAGDAEAREMYFFFPDRPMPDAYERTFR